MKPTFRYLPHPKTGLGNVPITYLEVSNNKSVFGDMLPNGRMRMNLKSDTPLGDYYFSCVYPVDI